MIEGQTQDIRQDTTVTPDVPSQTLGTLADMGKTILDQAAQSKIQANTSAAQLAISKLNNDYQVKNQADPMANLADYQKARQGILDQYGAQVNPFYQQEWNEKSQMLGDTNDAAMEAWGIKQSKENFVTNINQSLKDTFQLANQNGEQFAQGKGDIDSMLNFAQARGTIEQFGNDHLGQTTTTDMLVNFNKDYAKAFVAGVAQQNPQKAAALMQDPRIQSQFTTEQQDEMINLIKSTDKEQNINKMFADGNNNTNLLALVNDPNQTFYQKKLTIDTMAANNQISSMQQRNFDRLLTSSQKVDAATDAPTMAGIVQKTYDLNGNSSLNSSDYLKGVADIHQELVQAQADGKLSPTDTISLNKQIQNLTAAKVASATNAVGASFGEANTIIKQLPPELRADATRQLFYANTQGQTPLTGHALNEKAYEIVDAANTQRRKAALATIQKVNSGTLEGGGGSTFGQPLSDDDLQILKDSGFSADDANETAKNYGLNPADVVNKLRNGK